MKTNPTVSKRNKLCKLLFIDMKPFVQFFVLIGIFIFSIAAQSEALPAVVQKTEIQKNETRIKNDFYKKYYRLKLSPQQLIELVKNSEFNQLTPESQDDFLHDLADQYRGYLQNQFPLLNSIFISKLDKFIYHFLLKELGFNFKRLSDITVSVNPKNHQMSVYRLSIEPVIQMTSAVHVLAHFNFGFNLDLLQIIPLQQVQQELHVHINWQSQIHDMLADIHLTRRKNKTLPISNQHSPDYKKMLEDKLYKGVVLIGSNMSALTLPAAGGYIRYYTDQGFQFTKFSQNVDTLQYLKNNIFGEEPMDFFAKEAHSDGDEKNFFRVGLLSQVYRGEKINSNGIKEIIEIAMPQKTKNPNTLKTELISNNQFAEWIKQRSEKNGTELIYLNGSCWSYSKAFFEIAAVNSPLLINIPTKTVSLVFNSTSRNGTFQLFDGIQKRLSYDDIRKKLNLNSDYVNRQKDYYVFPDEPNYQRDFQSFGLNNFEFEIKLMRKFKGQFIDYSVETDNFDLF
jgi:hypothetical protein